MLFFEPILFILVCQESRRSSSAAHCRAPRSGAQRSSTQPGSILQRERGSESKRCPSSRWIQTGSYPSGDLWRICKYITQVQRITACTRFCSGILKISELSRVEMSICDVLISIYNPIGRPACRGPGPAANIEIPKCCSSEF